VLTDPVALSIGAAHNASAAAVQLAWQLQLGMAVNPRSQNAAHMLQLLSAPGLTLTAAEMAALSSRPQYACAPPECSTWSTQSNGNGA
jgi:diketogulonate reductase-like aldo/keto reductase